ncbi:MAG TPA: PD-(D/E)XK nuclease family protein [Solirubrobacteraceae bacterium]|nr:PD-(D/E)XK nuclease family protein [Solirubrobacteraceae bacterium]
MSIHLVTGPANSGKASVLLGEMRARVARGEEPLLIVPTRADQARYRRELAQGGVTMGARVERFDGLLAEVVARAGVGLPAVGSLTRERLLARLVGARPGLARALAGTVVDLEGQRITPARLRGALRVWSSAKASRSEQMSLFAQTDTPESHREGHADERSTLDWLSDVYERYQQALAKMRRSDRELRWLAALDALRRKPALWGQQPVLIYGFDDLTELQFDAIETLGTVVDSELFVSLAYEPGRVAFAGRAAAFQRLEPLVSEHTQRQARPDYYAPGSRAALHHLERSLLEESAERVVPGDAVGLLQGSSPRAEFELVAAEVRALLDAGVAADAIAIVHRSPQRIAALLSEALSAKGVPHALRRRLAFADTAAGRGLLGALRCALGIGQLGDLLAWLRVPGMLEQPRFADWLEARARRTGALDADRARSVWEAERWPLERIDRIAAAAAAGERELVDALLLELERLFTARGGGCAPLLAGRELDEAAALAAGRRALEQLRELARLDPESGGVTEVPAVLESLDFMSGEEPGAGQVAVVDPLGLRARRVGVLFVCGMQEGVFPAPPSPPLIPEGQRRALAQASGLVLHAAADSLAAERYLLYAFVSRPYERLILSWHTAGEDGAPRPRSLFVDDVCDLFDPIPVRVAAPVAGSTAKESLGERPDQCIAPLRDERVLAELRERRLWSASSLELWAACPVKWFVERLLHGDELGPDAEPLARGSLAHAALKLTFERLRERIGSARITPASVFVAKELLGFALEELGEQYPLSVAPERLPGARRRLRVDLERYLDSAAERCSPLEPTHLEFEFGFDDRDPSSPPPLDLGDDVYIRGRIDRIDIGEAGEAVIYDYKGRAAPPAAHWLQDSSWQVALYMRVAQHALGKRAVGGFYQPLAGKELAARGALDSEAAVELDIVRTDSLSHEAFERLVDDCVAAARSVAVQVRSGALAPQPDSCAYNGGCSYPTICRCER